MAELQSKIMSSDQPLLARFGQGIDNLLTGDLDYQRELEMLGFTQDFNAEQAAINRDWQERMANTAYQRGKADMIAAGLNPYLAYEQGGAAVPSGSLASAQGSHSAQSGTGFTKLIGTILGLANTAMQGSNKLAVASLQANNAREIANTRATQMQAYNDAREAMYQSYLDDKARSYEYWLHHGRKK